MAELWQNLSRTLPERKQNPRGTVAEPMIFAGNKNTTRREPCGPTFYYGALAFCFSKKLLVKLGTKINLADGLGAVRVVLPWFCPRHPQAHDFFAKVVLFAGSEWFCRVCFAFARSCWFCLTFDAVLLVLLSVPRGSAASAPRLRGSAGSE